MRPLLFLVLTACGGSGVVDKTDADGDRYTADEDCDDNDASSHPNGTEVCDGADNDCNGEVDDGVGSPVYLDADGDGYGDPATESVACDGTEAGMSDNADDCDDSDPAVSPLAEEICDGIDNDCDGAPDWGLGVPGSHASIQDAIGAAWDGAHICVSAGTYVETIDFAGRNVFVEGLDGPELTILDGGGRGPVVSFDTQEGPDARLSGFTITGGDYTYGAGVFILRADPTLDNLVITGNSCASESTACVGTGLYASDSDFTLTDVSIVGNHQEQDLYYGMANYGAGMYLGGAGTPVLTRVEISGNSASLAEASYYSGYNRGVGLYGTKVSPELHEVTIAGNTGSAPGTSNYTYGAGFYFTESSPVLERVVVADNVAQGAQPAGGGGFLYYTTFEAINTVIANNVAGSSKASTARGGGLYVSYSTPTLENVDVVGNRTVGETAQGGGLYVTYYGSFKLTNTSFASNESEGSTSSSGPAAEADSYYYTYTPTIAYSNFYDHGDAPFANLTYPGTSGGNLAVDPRYTSTSGDGVDWDLTLQTGSELIDAGDPDIEDVDGTRSDIGSLGGPGGG